MGAVRKLCRLNPQQTLFLLCDVQEKFEKAIPLFRNMLINVNKLLLIARTFKVPVIGTEQYPEKLGKTCKELDTKDVLGIVPKTKFSMYIPELLCIMEQNLKEQPTDVVIFGLETHICVTQTAIDFLANDYKVHLVMDCVASRLNQDRDVAVKLFRDIGCFVQTSEMIAFSLLGDKENPGFDSIRKLVAKTSEDMQIAPTMQPQPTKKN